MYDEMYDHLTTLQLDYIERGYSKNEAEVFAMKDFGQAAAIGDGLQQALFPYRKELLFILAIGSYLFVCIQYFYVLLTENVANNWVFIPTFAHTFLLFFALNQTYALNRKLWLNLSLVLNLFLMYLFAYPDFSYNPTWSIVLYVLLALTIFLIYRTALTYPVGGKNVSQKRLIHVVNITLGFLLIVVFGFFLWAGLFFGSLVSYWSLANYAIPFIIWMLVYSFQIHLANKQSKWLKVSYLLWLYVFIYVATFFSLFTSQTDIFGIDIVSIFRRILYPIQPSL